MIDFQMIRRQPSQIIASMSINEQIFTVYVRLHNGNGILISINEKTTLQLFKMLLEQSSLELYSQYELIFEGKEIKNPQKLLIDYGIKDKSVIHVQNKSKSPNKIKIDISIFYKNEKVFIRILANETIYDLKQKIFRLLQIHPKDQKLIFKGAILQNNKKMNYYNIMNDSLISLSVNKNAKLDLKEISNSFIPFSKQLLKNATSMRYIPSNLNHSLRSFQSCKQIDETNHSGYEIDIKQNYQEMNCRPSKQFSYQHFNQMFKIQTLSTCDSNIKTPNTPQTQNSNDWSISQQSSKSSINFQKLDSSSTQLYSEMV